MQTRGTNISRAWTISIGIALAVALVAVILLNGNQAFGAEAPGGETRVGAPSPRATTTASPSSSATASPATSPTPKPPVKPTQRQFDRVVLAGGQRQRIACWGTGSVTAVIVSGLGASTSMWERAVPGFASATRVCSTDRPGLGGSRARRLTKTVTARTHAVELRAVLLAVGETGPQILVGHSYGALVVRSYAKLYPRSVAGVLLLDGSFPKYRGPWGEGNTLINMAASSRFLGGNGPRLGAKPLIVLTSGEFVSRRFPRVITQWDAQQRAAARLSTNVAHVVAYNSGHVVQMDNPRAVVEALQELVTAVKTKKKLPRCSANWKNLQVSCRTH